MGKRLVIISGAFAAWILVPAAAQAFEQQAPAATVAPATPAPVAVPESPASKLDETPSAPDSEKGKGLKIPGIGKITIPKLNFGLDLMYGSQEKSDTELQFAPIEPTDQDDVRIMGKVKRRF